MNPKYDVMLNSLVKCQRNMMAAERGWWWDNKNSSGSSFTTILILRWIRHKSLWWKHSRHANHRKQKIRRSVQICIPVSVRHVKLLRHQVSQNFKVEVEILGMQWCQVTKWLTRESSFVNENYNVKHMVIHIHWCANVVVPDYRQPQSRPLQIKN